MFEALPIHFNTQYSLGLKSQDDEIVFELLLRD